MIPTRIPAKNLSLKKTLKNPAVATSAPRKSRIHGPTWDPDLRSISHPEILFMTWLNCSSNGVFSFTAFFPMVCPIDPDKDIFFSYTPVYIWQTQSHPFSGISPEETNMVQFDTIVMDLKKMTPHMTKKCGKEHIRILINS